MAENDSMGRRKRDDALLWAFAKGLTVRAAAKEAGIGERTATRRAADPAFRQRVAELRAELLQQAAARLTGASTAAAQTLRKLLRADAASIQLQAAKAILEIGTKVRETVEIEVRLTELENRLTHERT